MFPTGCTQLGHTGPNQTRTTRTSTSEHVRERLLDILITFGFVRACGAFCERVQRDARNHFEPAAHRAKPRCCSQGLGSRYSLQYTRSGNNYGRSNIQTARFAHLTLRGVAGGGSGWSITGALYYPNIYPFTPAETPSNWKTRCPYWLTVSYQCFFFVLSTKHQPLAAVSPKYPSLSQLLAVRRYPRLLPSWVQRSQVYSFGARLRMRRVSYVSGTTGIFIQLQAGST